MIRKVISIGPPFHLLEVFSLVEPVEETETEIVFQERLYLENRYAEGGKVLLKKAAPFTLPKQVPVVGPQNKGAVK